MISSRKLEIQGDISYKVGSIKDRKCMDLTGAEDIKKRWQEYTEELYKKFITTQIIMISVITPLESDILECKSSGPLKASL